MPNPSELDRPDEDFAIADMRELSKNQGYSEPYYHPEGVIEIYIVLGGFALSVNGGVEQRLGPGDVLITPSMTMHYVIPDDECVIAAISRPPFTPESYIPISATDPSVGFDEAQFERLTTQVPA